MIRNKKEEKKKERQDKEKKNKKEKEREIGDAQKNIIIMLNDFLEILICVKVFGVKTSYSTNILGLLFWILECLPMSKVSKISS